VEDVSGGLAEAFHEALDGKALNSIAEVGRVATILAQPLGKVRRVTVSKFEDSCFHHADGASMRISRGNPIAKSWIRWFGSNS
jgi:hypothetical protein